MQILRASTVVVYIYYIKLKAFEMQISDSVAKPSVRVNYDRGVAVIVIDNPPVNAGSIEVRRKLIEAVNAAAQNDACIAAVVIGAGNTFVAGSDIREFGMPLADPQLPAVITAIQLCPKPFIAAIHGVALGGGFELALGCDYRLATPNAVVGLPEVSLGMIPGAGGTQHVPRLAGIANAIDLICSGKRIKGEEALQCGLVDMLVTHDIKNRAIEVAIEWGKQRRKRRLSEEHVPQEDAERISIAASSALRAGRGRPQVVAAIEAVKSSAILPYSVALSQERAVFQQLRSSVEAAALRHLFFAEREAKKVVGLENATIKQVNSVGIIGAGTMGTGIAACFADVGFDVVVVDQDNNSIARGLQRLNDIYSRMVKSGKLAASEAKKRLMRVQFAEDYASLADVDLVIEAVFESMDVKSEVFRRLNNVLRPDVILASNTSYLNLDELALSARNPELVVGMHFFSPAHVMRLMEVVQGAQTSQDTLATSLWVANKIRKLPVVAKVGEGFIGNRIYAAYRKQCEFMLEEGAYPEEVDDALEKFGFAMGPFAVGDMSGLDIAWRMRTRLNASRDVRTRYVDIPDRLCELGRFGQKTGSGWYKYEPGARKGGSDPIVRTVIEASSMAKGYTRRNFTVNEIQRRALSSMVNEAALILQENIAARASDIDLVMVNGYGFPKHEGGPLFWASRQPREHLIADLDTLAIATGHGFREGNISIFLG